jgi:hypothetical protein
VLALIGIHWARSTAVVEEDQEEHQAVQVVQVAVAMVAVQRH